MRRRPGIAGIHQRRDTTAAIRTVGEEASERSLRRCVGSSQPSASRSRSSRATQVHPTGPGVQGAVPQDVRQLRRGPARVQQGVLGRAPGLRRLLLRARRADRGGVPQLEGRERGTARAPRPHGDGAEAPRDGRGAGERGRRAPRHRPPQGSGRGLVRALHRRTAIISSVP